MSFNKLFLSLHRLPSNQIKERKSIAWYNHKFSVSFHDTWSCFIPSRATFNATFWKWLHNFASDRNESRKLKTKTWNFLALNIAYGNSNDESIAWLFGQNEKITATSQLPLTMF